MPYLGALAGKTSWRSPLCNSMLRYHTNVILARFLGAWAPSQFPHTMLSRLIGQAKAFPFTSMLPCLPTGELHPLVPLLVLNPHPPAHPPYNFSHFTCFALVRSALPGCSTELLVPLP